MEVLGLTQTIHKKLTKSLDFVAILRIKMLPNQNEVLGMVK